MGEDNSRESGYKIEKEFKDFMKKLLDAQSYNFMKEKFLFSRTTLEAILKKFCDIIAKEVDCESCTIHLQMYDSQMMAKEPLKEYIVEHLLNAYKSYVGDTGKIEEDLRTILTIIVNPGPDREKTGNLKKLPENFRKFVKSRIDFLASSLIFPYWAYAEGAASLVAINKDGPWDPIMEKMNSRLKYISPYSGVSKFIFKENVAKVRDRLSIRETRNFRKLGTADMIVWNNTCWKYVFKNYYGVPIRIHSGGEVVGILKAENKRTYWADENKNSLEVNKHIRKIFSSRNLIDEIIAIINKHLKNNSNLNSLNVSFLSLVYLEDDLNADECKKNADSNCRFERLMFIPYPQCEHVRNILEEMNKRISNDLLGNPNHGEDINEFLRNEPEDSSKWPELFHKKDLLCGISRSFINDFYYCEKEIEKLESELRKIEMLKEYDPNKAAFKNYVLEIFKRFDTKIEEIRNRTINFLKPVGDGKSPPMQLYTRSIDDEKRLWNLLVRKKNCHKLYNKIREFYKIFKEEVYQNIHYDTSPPKLHLYDDEKNSFEKKVENIIKNTRVKASIDNWPNRKLPDFHFKISLEFSPSNKSKSGDTQTIDFYMVVLPTRKEFRKGNILGNKKEYYEKVNRYWLEESEDQKNKLEIYCNHRQKIFNEPGIEVKGEFIVFDGSVTVTDFILDRLAARIQAFAHSLPLAQFSFDDTYKLTWAAYEIGKLIEREISYRANRNINPIPLTAMEFYRIPISSLSFVDDLVSRRTNLEKIADNIDVYIKNIIFEMDMVDEVEYSSRMKEYRSMFQRIGERFEGYIRGNIALWVFLLSLIIEEDNEFIGKQGNKDNNRNECGQFLNNLKKFRGNIIRSMNQQDKDFFENYRKSGKLTGLYGDLKFDSPPFLVLDAKNFLDIYKTKKEVEEIQTKKEIETNKLEKVLINLQKIIRYQAIEFKLKGGKPITHAFNQLMKSVCEILQSLNDFKKKEKTNIIYLDKEIKVNLEHIKKILGDIFKKEKNDYEGKLTDAFNIIRGNLEKEGFGKDSFRNIDNANDIESSFRDNREMLTNLLLHNYSYFIRDSLSLLIQIANLLRSLKNDKLENFEDFKTFYRKCRELREFLCTSPQQLEGEKKYHLEKIFGIGKNSDNEASEWAEIKMFINSNTTDSISSSDDKDYLSLNQESIYTRIRLLNRILHRQIPVAMLDWELGRFDLYGTRMNCLFKNQVFLLYEKIWNKGDPFFFYVPDAEVFEDYHYYNDKKKEIATDKYRQRWICLRTKILRGEYNATQFAALLDPKTAEPGYWEHINTYNLKSVQYILGKIFDKFEGRAAWRYRNFSWHRHLISKCHHKWYIYKINLLKKEIPQENNIQRKTRWFGSFLFSGVINLLLLLLRSTIDYENELDNQNRYGFQKETLEIIDKKMKSDINNNLFYGIIQYLYHGIESGVKYSDKIKKAVIDNTLLSQISFVCNCKNTPKSPGRDEGNKLLVCLNPQKKNGTCYLYQKAIKFVEEIIADIDKGRKHPPQMTFDRDIFEKIINNLQEEMQVFIELEKKDTIEEFQIPLFYIDGNQRDQFGHKILDVFSGILRGLERRLKNKNSVEVIEVNYWAFIYRTLEHIRREQNSYLFDMGDKNNDHGGLWMLDKKEILERIKNYVLLYSEKWVDESNRQHFFGWNAHDLYYYIHSLIPMEIQIRTELTNTFAVQYHDSIYKVQPSPGTEFPHTMIKNAGEALDKIDREIEIDYEDYILKTIIE